MCRFTKSAASTPRYCLNCVAAKPVVITSTPGVLRVARAVRDGYIDGNKEAQLSLKPGDVVYLLTPLGEGAYKFWYRGKVYQARSGAMPANPDTGGKGMTPAWWKQVRNNAGKTGWTKSDDFSNVDACG